MYATLDAAILDALKAGNVLPFNLLWCRTSIRSEADRIARETDRSSFRVLDGRITALRKRSLIEPAPKKAGWRQVASAGNAANKEL